MCGRITIKIPLANVQEHFSIARGLDVIKDWSPRYNVGPTTPVPCVRVIADSRELFSARWGLIPSGTTGVKPTGSFNAKSETLVTCPLYQDAFKSRRCLVIASGFYEWQFLSPHDSQPYYITLRSGAPMAMAGVWESWQSSDGEFLETCAICTTKSNSMMERIYDRMPVILPTERFDQWLDPMNQDSSTLLPLLSPLSSEELQAWPVSKDVGNVARQGAYLIKPIF
ncbi:SOS response-associated peptidase [Schlesneria paludicola]|uniref:SOS response-associated peptidase n=1 Tax=Schlesneria paludicola TaxID=360056 RepID=UPI000299E084|nr:SOS response-associated peptidase [Schlesneria paludicola]